MSLTAIKGLIEASALLRLKDKTDHPLKRSAILLTRDFKALTAARFAILAAGLILCSLVLIFPQSGPALAAASFILIFSGDCLERHLFFRAVVPPRMPGALA